MGFLSGRATFERYWITHDPTPALGVDHIESLKKHKIANTLRAALEQPKVGFLAGAHLLDTKFDLEKNILVDAMHFGVRIDSDQIPSAVRNAWLQMELLPVTVDNPSGKPTKSQRQEAKEAVEARCLEEAATGKFRRMQQIPILWDALHDVIYVGTTSPVANELCIDLLQRSFDIQVERVTASKLVRGFAEEHQLREPLQKLSPALVHDTDVAGTVVWWNGMADNYDYLGNEFLLWLWWRWDTDSDTLALSDDSQVSGMFARTLTLDCPLGENGKETISAVSPVVLPEAALAVRSGKLPRKAGLTLVRHDEQYEFSLQAESFTVGGAKMAYIGNDTEISADRSAVTCVDRLRGLTETLDLLFAEFCRRRLGTGWNDDLREIRKWLRSAAARDQRMPAA